MTSSFRVGVTPNVRKPDGTILYDFSLLDTEPDLEWSFLSSSAEIARSEAQSYDALILATSVVPVTARTLAERGRLTLVARLGAGLESIDLDACTAAGVLVTTAPDGVRRPMATSALALLLALTHRLIPKDRATREGRWDAGLDDIGEGLVDRTLGLIGLGNIGREVVRVTAPLGLRYLAYDPYLNRSEPLAGATVELVSLETLLAESDFVCVTCPLTRETHHLLDADRLALLKSTAHLINIARGPIVDQAALTEALRDRRIGGAALDVFEQEPIDSDDPILKLDNVIVTPHAIGWTDEVGTGCGQSGCRAVLAVGEGKVPQYVANPAVLENPLLQAKLQSYDRRARTTRLAP